MISIGKKFFACIVSGALVFSFGGGLFACTAEQPEEPIVEEEAVEYRTIGTPSEGALEILVENATGSAITEVAIKEASEAEYGNPLITKKDMIEDGETVLVYIPQSALGEELAASSEPQESASNENKEADESATPSSSEADTTEEDASSNVADVVLRTLYNIELTLESDAADDDAADDDASDDGTAADASGDDAAATSDAPADDASEETDTAGDSNATTANKNLVVELHNINLEELNEVTICLSNEGLAYIEYKNDEGKKESTLETEKALKAEEEAAAEAEAQAQAEAEAAAQAQAEAEAAAAAAAEQAYQYDYGYSDSSGYSGSQSEDYCVDPNDLVFN